MWRIWPACWLPWWAAEEPIMEYLIYMVLFATVSWALAEFKKWMRPAQRRRKRGAWTAREAADSLLAVCEERKAAAICVTSCDNEKIAAVVVVTTDPVLAVKLKADFMEHACDRGGAE